MAAYAICLFFLTILWSNVWGDATACPYYHIEDLLEGKTSVRIVALKTWAQIMGGCCVYRFVQIFWWFEFAQTHEGRAFENCTADLQVSFGGDQNRTHIPHIYPYIIDREPAVYGSIIISSIQIVLL